MTRHRSRVDVTLTQSQTPKQLPRGIVRDSVYPNMYRLALADGSLSDMLNLTRAKDALAAVSEASAA